MHKTDTTIGYVGRGSLAEEAGIAVGDRVISINGKTFADILEYRFLISEPEVELVIEKPCGAIEGVIIENDYEDLGIDFKQGLIDIPQSCRNKCIFCFIDQLPKGMRETVYFKDDDTRLSFLQGNYVTLTNLSENDIQRMIDMHISPINISVHTTNPKLREKMLGNRFAGNVYELMKRFAENEIVMNCQIVLCPEINDGAELERTVDDLGALYPYVASVAIVPVGLTEYRDGLYPLREFRADEHKNVIEQIERYQRKYYDKYGTRLVYLSDEFYINAGRDLPKPCEYEGFPQIENGVGLVASLVEEFDEATGRIPKRKRSRNVVLITGELVFPYIQGMCRRLEQLCDGLKVSVYAIKNNFFGGGVNVSGLVCGCDIIEQLRDKIDCETLLLPAVMLRDGEDVFLDDTTVGDVERELSVKVVSIENDGYDFVEKIIGENLEF
jgi:putative radical SAM enzyme (TIGR03279 family)